MTERRPRTILLSVLLTSLSVGVLPAVAQDPAEDWALKIVDRRVDEATGRVTLALWNRSDQEVLAYAIRTVFPPGSGGGMGISGQSFVEGYGIAPGTTKEVQSGTWIADAPSSVPEPSVELVFEILADNSAHGDERFVESEFASRRAGWTEYDAALGCLREGAESVEIAADFLALLEDVRACGEAVLESMEGEDPGDDRSGGPVRAIVSGRSGIEYLMDQMRERFEAGDSADFLISSMDQLLEEELARRARGLRPSDLERLGR